MSLEEIYEHARKEIDSNRAIDSLKSIRKNLEKALVGINDTITKTKAEIVIKYGLGYNRNEDLDRAAFPGGKEISRTVDIKTFSDGKEISGTYESGVTVVIIQDKDGTQNKLYFSKEMGIYIKGEPEKRKDGLYCQITGHKISE